MLVLSKENPSPFKQPFLELVLLGGGVKNLAPNTHEREDFTIWWIDVDGAIDKYITDVNAPTDLLIELCKSLAKAGVVVKDYARYVGSAGPNVILRNGALFYRMRTVEEPGEEVFAYEYRTPLYRGPK